MPKSVNKVILLGHVGKDPELKYTPSNVPVCTFSLATNERWKDRDGNWQDRTEWHNIVAWQRAAETLNEYVRKGAQLYIEGKIQTRSWDDRNTGEKKYRTEIVVNEFTLLEKSDRDEGTRAAPRPQQSQPEPAPSDQITDEDVPF